MATKLCFQLTAAYTLYSLGVCIHTSYEHLSNFECTCNFNKWFLTQLHDNKLSMLPSFRPTRSPVSPQHTSGLPCNTLAGSPATGSSTAQHNSREWPRNRFVGCSSISYPYPALSLRSPKGTVVHPAAAKYYPVPYFLDPISKPRTTESKNYIKRNKNYSLFLFLYFFLLPILY